MKTIGYPLTDVKGYAILWASKKNRNTAGYHAVFRVLSAHPPPVRAHGRDHQIYETEEFNHEKDSGRRPCVDALPWRVHAERNRGNREIQNRHSGSGRHAWLGSRCGLQRRSPLQRTVRRSGLQALHLQQRRRNDHPAGRPQNLGRSGHRRFPAVGRHGSAHPGRD